MSICPKNKTSKARRDKRRANWKMSAPTLVKCSKCGALMAHSGKLRPLFFVFRKLSASPWINGKICLIFIGWFSIVK